MTITPNEIETIVKVFKTAVPLGEEIVAGIKALFSIKYGTLTIDQIEAQWQDNLDEATKNATPPVV